MSVTWRFRRIWGSGGMSITELMVSLAISMLLLLVLGTELQAMVDRIKLESAVSELIGDLQSARIQAIWERQAIKVSINQASAVVTVFRESDPIHPIRPPRNLAGRGVRTIQSTGGNLLSFSPSGTSGTATSLTLEGRNGDRRVVTVSLTGIVRAR
jgi:type II secretory pathway pseudopilin PulG